MIFHEIYIQMFLKETWFDQQTFIGTQGYSGNAAATARAPASFVKCDKPTKNSRPITK